MVVDDEKYILEIIKSYLLLLICAIDGFDHRIMALDVSRRFLTLIPYCRQISLEVWNASDRASSQDNRSQIGR